MNNLVCTCHPGENVEGTKQEIIEQRLAVTFELTVPEVHVLLDLHLDTLDAVLDLPVEERDEGRETVRRMAEKSGRTFGWMQDFLTAWEFESDALESKTHQPWGGLTFGRLNQATVNGSSMDDGGLGQ